jgi:hypothetical protein
MSVRRSNDLPLTAESVYISLLRSENHLTESTPINISLLRSEAAQDRQASHLNSVNPSIIRTRPEAVFDTAASPP